MLACDLQRNFSMLHSTLLCVKQRVLSFRPTPRLRTFTSWLMPKRLSGIGKRFVLCSGPALRRLIPSIEMLRPFQLRSELSVSRVMDELGLEKQKQTAALVSISFIVSLH
jgi:hypothetical protein